MGHRHASESRSEKNAKGAGREGGDWERQWVKKWGLSAARETRTSA